MVMYGAIFGMAQNTEFMDATPEIYMTFSDPVVTELGSEGSDTTCDLDRDFYWVSLPGAHPIKLTRQLVIEQDLRDHIVSDRKRLKQIRLYQRRGFVPSLMGCCHSSADLADKLEAMGWFTNEGADDSSTTGRAVYFETHE